MPRKKNSEKKPPIEPQMVIREDGSLEILTPFHKLFIEDLKACIPWQHREFIDQGEGAKIWVVDHEWRDTAQEVVNAYFPTAVFLDFRGATPVPF
jgi:hypothetical protein